MRKLIYFCVAILSFCLFFISVNAQSKQPYGYSKSYVYKGDSLRRSGTNISTIISLNTSKSNIFAHLSTDRNFNYLLQWEKIDKDGNIIKEITDSFPFNDNAYINDLKFCINDSAYYYSNGWYNNHESWDATVILEKRDTNLNLIWKKEYP